MIKAPDGRRIPLEHIWAYAPYYDEDGIRLIVVDVRKPDLSLANMQIEIVEETQEAAVAFIATLDRHFLAASTPDWSAIRKNLAALPAELKKEQP